MLGVSAHFPILLHGYEKNIANSNEIPDAGTGTVAFIHLHGFNHVSLSVPTRGRKPTF